MPKTINTANKRPNKKTECPSLASISSLAVAKLTANPYLGTMPKGPKGEKRPADGIGNAVHVMRIATGEIEDSRAQGKQRAKPKKRQIGPRPGK